MNNKIQTEILPGTGVTAARLQTMDPALAKKVRLCIEARSHRDFPHLHARFAFEAARALGRSSPRTPEEKEKAIVAWARREQIVNDAANAAAQELADELGAIGWLPSTYFVEQLANSQGPSAAWPTCSAATFPVSRRSVPLAGRSRAPRAGRASRRGSYLSRRWRPRGRRAGPIEGVSHATN